MPRKQAKTLDQILEKGIYEIPEDHKLKFNEYINYGLDSVIYAIIPGFYLAHFEGDFRNIYIFETYQEMDEYFKGIIYAK